MKIVIANGNNQADYIISKYNTRVNDLIVINEDEEVCKRLSMQNGISVNIGDATKEGDLRDAGAEDADLFIALSENDVTNYIACQIAKKILGAKRCIAVVINPKNVQVFRQLGIDSVLCSTYLLGEVINNAASVENLMNSLTLDDNQIIILEFRIISSMAVCGKTLKEIGISDLATVSAIYRNQKGIIPNGNTVLENNDRVLVVTTEDNRDSVMKVFQRKK